MRLDIDALAIVVDEVYGPVELTGFGSARTGSGIDGRCEDLFVGTEITLSLNGVDIDYGKNRYWKNHHWLFPPGSLTDITYRYANDVAETKSGFQTSLKEADFRLRHLGYSLQETKTKFDAAVIRWNRTADLRLTFEDFRTALTSIDFGTLTPADLAPFIWDFRAYVRSLLSAWDTNEAGLEDFIASLDFAITLRTLADRPANGSLALRWHHQDLVESGWVSLDDLTDIDRQVFVIDHTMLYGRLQDHAGKPTVKGFDSWLAGYGLPKATPYVKANPDGTVTPEVTTLPTAVRNMIHHPENPNNVLSDADLHESVESLLRVVLALPTPLPGLT